MSEADYNNSTHSSAKGNAVNNTASSSLSSKHDSLNDIRFNLSGNRRRSLNERHYSTVDHVDYNETKTPKPESVGSLSPSPQSTQTFAGLLKPSTPLQPAMVIKAQQLIVDELYSLDQQPSLTKQLITTIVREFFKIIIAIAPGLALYLIPSMAALSFWALVGIYAAYLTVVFILIGLIGSHLQYKAHEKELFRVLVTTANLITPMHGFDKLIDANKTIGDYGTKLLLRDLPAFCEHAKKLEMAKNEADKKSIIKTIIGILSHVKSEELAALKDSPIDDGTKRSIIAIENLLKDKSFQFVKAHFSGSVAKFFLGIYYCLYAFDHYKKDSLTIGLVGYGIMGLIYGPYKTWLYYDLYAEKKTLRQKIERSEASSPACQAMKTLVLTNNTLYYKLAFSFMRFFKTVFDLAKFVVGFLFMVGLIELSASLWLWLGLLGALVSLPYFIARCAELLSKENKRLFQLQLVIWFEAISILKLYIDQDLDKTQFDFEKYPHLLDAIYSVLSYIFHNIDNTNKNIDKEALIKNIINTLLKKEHDSSISDLLNAWSSSNNSSATDSQNAHSLLIEAIRGALLIDIIEHDFGLCLQHVLLEASADQTNNNANAFLQSTIGNDYTSYLLHLHKQQEHTGEAVLTKLGGQAYGYTPSKRYSSHTIDNPYNWLKV